ncbi:MAG: hypothetical protein RLZZ08_1001 [Pseudomonadota bacterium]|jgi:glycosyltransferase involved in cell wall biosynthesis
MRIALVNISLQPGRGSDQVTLELAERLAPLHQVTVYSLKPAADAGRGFDVVAPRGTSLQIRARFLATMRRELAAFDVVNCHHAVISLLLPSRNLLTTYHGFRGRLNLRFGNHLGEAISRTVRRFVIRPSLGRSQAVVLVSRSLEKEAGAAGNCLPRIVYNGVAGPEQPIQRQKPKHLLYVGRLDPDKNVRELLATYRSADSLPPLLVVGDGAERGELEAEFADKSIRFLGRVGRKELDSLYAEAHAFVTASTFETFCLPVIEAAHVGCPSIGYRSGSLPEVIADGRTGWLTDDFARDGASLLRKAATLSDCERAEVERNCRDWAEGFSWDRALQQYSDLFVEIAAGPPQ